MEYNLTLSCDICEVSVFVIQGKGTSQSFIMSDYSSCECIHPPIYKELVHLSAHSDRMMATFNYGSVKKCSNNHDMICQKGG